MLRRTDGVCVGVRPSDLVLALGFVLVLTVCQVNIVQAQAAPLCRLGLNVFRVRVGAFDLQPLRAGWYVDGWAWSTETRPQGIDYFPVIQLAQVGADDFSFQPNGAALDAAIAAHPGAFWIIGNEPDRRDWQNDLTPSVYALAYHDVRAYVLDRDPQARFLPGSIVQPTPLRLQYLDMVLAAYRDRYGEPLPADGWSLHNFILNERSCEAFPDACWGAAIPPGIDVTEGMVITDLNDHVRLDIFIQQIERFRRWMADKGYRNTPLYLTEYGVLLPGSGFPPARVNGYMTATFDYLLSAVDPTIGYAPDGNRLVQRYAWFSAVDPIFNGSLFVSTAGAGPYDPPFVLTTIGDNFAAYARELTAAPDMNIVAVQAQAPAASGPVTATLTAWVANAGNGLAASGATVQFYAGNPRMGGAPIGAPHAVALAGCGALTEVTSQWPQVDPADGLLREVFVRVTATADVLPGNNSASAWLLLGNHRAYFPLLFHR